MEGRDDVLSVRDLEIGYATGRGLVKAVRGVSFDLGDDENLGVIDEWREVVARPVQGAEQRSMSARTQAGDGRRVLSRCVHCRIGKPS